MDKDTVLKIEGLGKRYIISHKGESNRGSSHYVALRDVIVEKASSFAKNILKPKRWFQGSDKEDFWALKDINLEVKRGDKVAIIGHNGAGKSTLLKILSRITEPTEGEIKIRGRVTSLLEVGTGFHPELTGRENIYLNGSILGMAHTEIDRKFDEIVAFAGVEKFLDTPVKRYSSGMRMRLGFAVAAHLESEILIIDEVLAVGDAEFQKKCIGKMDEISKTGERTILFVSHNMGAVQQLCEKGILLEHGAVKYSGNVCQVIDRYNYQMINNEIVILNKSKMIESYKINIEGSLADEKSKVGINLNVLQKLENIFFDVALHNEKGERLVHIRNDKKYFFDLNKGTHWLYYEFEKMPIRAGDVFASFYLADKNKNETYLHLKNCHIAHFECEDDVYPTKPILYPDYSLHINETKKFEKYYGAKG